MQGCLQGCSGWHLHKLQCEGRQHLYPALASISAQEVSLCALAHGQVGQDQAHDVIQNGAALIWIVSKAFCDDLCRWQEYLNIPHIPQDLGQLLASCLQPHISGSSRGFAAARRMREAALEVRVTPIALT